MPLFAFQTLASGWLVLLCAASSVGLAWLLYRKDNRFAERPWKWILPSLRFVGLFFLLLLLLSPFLVFNSQKEEKPALLVYYDKSKSLPDSIGGNLYPAIEKQLSGLEDRYEIRSFAFGENVVGFADSGLKRSATDFGSLVDHVNDYQGSRRVSAVLVISDGILNKGINPLAKKLVKSPSLFTVGVGDTTPYEDLKLGPVQINESVFIGSEFGIETSLKWSGNSSVNWLATLYEGDNAIQRREGVLRAGSSFAKVEFKVKATSSGIKNYKVVVAPVSQERNIANNQAVGLTEVVDNRKSIALVQHAAHPDIAALVRVVEGNARYRLMLAEPGFLPEPAAADIFIVHGIPTADAREQAWIKRIAGSGKSIWYIASVQTQWSALASLAGGQVPNGSGKTEDVLPQVASDFSDIAFEPEVLKRISSWPPLKVAFGKWETNAGQHILLKQRIGSVITQYPLFYVRETGKQRSAWLTGEGLWRWKMKELATHGDNLAFESLVYNTLQYLGATGNNVPFVLTSLKKEYLQDDGVMLNATRYDAAGNADNSIPCELTIEDNKQFRRSVRMSGFGGGYRAEIGTLPPGNYKATATLKGGEKLTAGTSFFVNAISPEATQTQADFGLLRRWAGQNNGSFAAANQISGIIKQLGSAEQSKKILYTETKLTDLIHAKWFFLIILICFSGEWFLRKYLGGY